MTDPIKRLRECWLRNPVSGLKPFAFDYESGDVLADEIEAAYIKLPVDADGVPIRPGDSMEARYPQQKLWNGEVREAFSYRYTVESVIYDGDRWDLGYDGETTEDCASVKFDEYSHHVKPDTVESLLQELAEEVWNTCCESQTTWSDSGLDGIEGRYADQIRELLGGDAE